MAAHGGAKGGSHSGFGCCVFARSMCNQPVLPHPRKLTPGKSLHICAVVALPGTPVRFTAGIGV